MATPARLLPVTSRTMRTIPRQVRPPDRTIPREVSDPDRTIPREVSTPDRTPQRTSESPNTAPRGSLPDGRSLSGTF